jgi:hypothetical protein
MFYYKFTHKKNRNFINISKKFVIFIYYIQFKKKKNKLYIYKRDIL